MGIIFFSIAGFACIAGLCAAPVVLNVRGGADLRLNIRYLWFSRNIEFALKRSLPGFVANHNRVLGYIRFFRRRVARYVRVGRFHLKIEFSCGEAAGTALTHGLICGVLRTLYPRLNACKPEITLNPRFLTVPALSFYCDITLAVPALILLRMPASWFNPLVGLKPAPRRHPPVGLKALRANIPKAALTPCLRVRKQR
jgi:hypothetical protein